MEPLESYRWLWLAFAVIISVLLYTWLWRIAWRTILNRFRHHRRLRRAFIGESKAESLLLRSGYHLLRRQPRQEWIVSVDGSPLRIDLRADLLVEKGGKRFVAEVKTGSMAPRIRTPSTRRQLLEYRLAYDVDGVLLLDMENVAIRKIDFPVIRNRRVKHQKRIHLVILFIIWILLFVWIELFVSL